MDDQVYETTLESPLDFLDAAQELLDEAGDRLAQRDAELRVARAECDSLRVRIAGLTQQVVGLSNEKQRLLDSINAQANTIRDLTESLRAARRVIDLLTEVLA